MSGKTIAQKLLLKPGGTAWVSDPARSGLLGELPDGARLVDGLDAASVAVVVAESGDQARTVVAANHAPLAAVAAFWVAYPKGGRADINRDSLWPILAEHGFRPIGQVALDDAWSALRFRSLRPGEAQFTGGR